MCFAFGPVSVFYGSVWGEVVFPNEFGVCVLEWEGAGWVGLVDYVGDVQVAFFDFGVGGWECLL